jgi:hypothetical protein
MLHAPAAATDLRRSNSFFLRGSFSSRLVIWVAAAAVVAIGVCRYGQAPSFWLDEAFIAVSVRHRSLQSLFAPLEYGQYFPRLYLAAIVILRNVLGYQIWVLRLLPILSYVIGTLLWARLLAKRSGHYLALGLLGGALLLGASFWLEQAIQLKQYTLDVLVAILPFLLPDEFFEAALVDGRRTARTALLAIPCLFSYSYPMALGARLCGWYINQGRCRGWRLHLRGAAVLLIAVTLAFAVLWMTDYQFNLKNRAAYLTYWHDGLLKPRFAEGLASGFSLIANYLWGWHHGRFMPLVIAAVAPLQALGIYAVIRGWRNRQSDPSHMRWGSRTMGSLVLLAGVILASVLVNYPITAGRLTLFTQVHAQILAVEGAWFILSFWGARKMASGFLYAAIAIVVVYSGHGYLDFVRAEPRENIRPMLSSIRPEIAQTVWVHPCSVAQVESLPEPLPVAQVLIETKRKAQEPEGRVWILWTNLSDDYCQQRLDELRSRALTWQVVHEGPGRGLALADF